MAATAYEIDTGDPELAASEGCADPMSIRCPCDAKARLQRQDASLQCTGPGCEKSFPIVHGVPILINDANSVFAVSDYLKHQGYEGAAYTNAAAVGGSLLHRSYRRFAIWLSEFSVPLHYTSAEDALDRRVKESSRSGERKRVLVVGCGHLRLRQPDQCEIVYTDVAFGPLARYICDAHDLPFAGGSFDMVIAVAILEHVADPQRCVHEFHRVLRQGGWVYAATPFLQPVHMGAHDFTRFTYMGHRRLFRHFDEIDSGMALGPASSLAYCFQDFLTSFFTKPLARKVARLTALILTRPLKYLDLQLKRNRGSIDAAGGTYFVGQKRETPIPDREIIRAYRGLNAES